MLDLMLYNTADYPLSAAGQAALAEFAGVVRAAPRDQLSIVGWWISGPVSPPSAATVMCPSSWYAASAAGRARGLYATQGAPRRANHLEYGHDALAAATGIASATWSAIVCPYRVSINGDEDQHAAWPSDARQNTVPREAVRDVVLARVARLTAATLRVLSSR